MQDIGLSQRHPSPSDVTVPHRTFRLDRRCLCVATLVLGLFIRAAPPPDKTVTLSSSQISEIALQYSVAATGAGSYRCSKASQKYIRKNINIYFKHYLMSLSALSSSPASSHMQRQRVASQLYGAVVALVCLLYIIISSFIAVVFSPSDRILKVGGRR